MDVQNSIFIFRLERIHAWHKVPCMNILFNFRPTNKLRQKEITTQHQQNANTMQLLQNQNDGLL